MSQPHFLAQRNEDQNSPSTGESWGMFIAGKFIWFAPALAMILIVSVLTGLAFPVLAMLADSEVGLGFMFAMIAFFSSALLSYGIAYLVNFYRNMLNRQRARIILGYLENAVRLNLPLDKFLEAAQRSERGGTRRRLDALRLNLQRGLPVGTALRSAVPGYSEEHSAELTAAENLGQLQPALTRAVERNMQPEVQPAGDLSPFYRIYPLGLVTLLLLVCFWYFIFIVPKFHEILRDFKVDPPRPWLFISGVNQVLSDFWPITLLILIGSAITLTVLIGGQLRRFFTPWWPSRQFRPFIDWLAWKIPLWRQVSQDRAMAISCEVLAAGVRAGLPLTTSLEQALQIPANHYFTRGLEKWHDLVAAGTPTSEAAHEAGLPTIFVGFLSSTTQPGGVGSAEHDSQAEVYDFLARYYRDRFSRTTLLLRGALIPITVISMGALVGFFVYALFSPLVQVILKVMEYYPSGGVS